jgi:integrase
VVGVCGSLLPSQLNARVVRVINGHIENSGNHFTRKNRSNAVRWLLRKLENEGAPSLAHEVVTVNQPRPRNVTSTEAERQRILTAAPPHLRCWLLLCSDLAIRSGTAARLTPENYDPARRELIFTTKYQARQRLPVTAELAALLDRCTEPDVPFVAQLPRATATHGQPLHALGHMDANSLRKLFARLRQKLGIRRKLTAHDLRRTTATRIYDATRDVRLVQALLGHGDLGSTLWYLDHHLTPVPASALELAKLNTTTETVQ